MIKKQSLPLLIMLIGLSGCAGSKKKIKANKKNNNKNSHIVSQIDIPLAENTETIRSFFDSDVNDFLALEQEMDVANVAQQSQKVAQNNTTESIPGQLSDKSDDFNWIQDISVEHDGMSKIYFKFGEHSINKEQKNNLKNNINHAKKMLADSRKNGIEPTVVIEGHACRSAGSAVYNLALSEKRAKAVADYLVKNGIARENIKIVGRGYEVPEIVDGKPVDGDKKAQWPNRRSEIHVIYS